MEFKIIWTERALADLQAIRDYIATANLEAAERVGLDIIRHAELLASFPHIGPTYPRGTKSTTREIISGKYRIFYRVIESQNVVQVLTIWHGARDEPNLS
jgi:toxin ParE1/3/4